MARTKLLDIWKRAETGPICPTRKFDLEVYWKRLKELVKEYDIKYDKETPIPTDESLIDDTYKAGLDLLLDVGVLCTDTERIIKLHEDEIKEALRTLPGKVAAGEGKDAILVENRKIEDPRPPIIFAGTFSLPVSEEMAVRIYMSHIQEPLVDTFYPGVVTFLEGVDVKAGSPMELHAEMTNLYWVREAQRRVGRPGMPIQGSPSASPIADISGSCFENGYKKTDFRCVLMRPQMKVDYGLLCRAIHFIHYGCPKVSLGTGYIGGLAGGPEGAAITTVAETLAEVMIYQTELDYVGPLNNMPSGTTDLRTMWSSFLSNAAINKNTKHVTIGEGYMTYAGPCTDMCLYEVAATTIGHVVTGSHPCGVATNQGGIGGRTDYSTGMETKFMGEVAHASVGLKRTNANDLVKFLVSKYEERMKNRTFPEGKRFQECYNTSTITPSAEYLDLRRKVGEELSDAGLDLSSFH